jgi:hypothetical protein
MNRTNQILLGILVAQLLLVAVIFWPRPAASSANQPLLPDFKAADISKLTLSDGEGNRVALAKKGDTWVLPEADDYPADSSKITPLLEKIAKVKTNRLVTETEGSQARLKVAKDSFNSLIETEQTGGPAYQLYVGSSAGAAATHVRAGDQPQVFLTGELTSFDVPGQAASWIDPLYFTLPQTATIALTLENQNGVFEFVKEGETWTMKGLAADEMFNENNFSTLLGQATGVRMAGPIGKTEEDWFALDKPQAKLTLTTQDGETYTLRVGGQDAADKSYVFNASNSPYYVRLAEFTAQAFTEKTRPDFIQPPVTPAPETTPAP